MPGRDRHCTPAVSRAAHVHRAYLTHALIPRGRNLAFPIRPVAARVAFKAGSRRVAGQSAESLQRNAGRLPSRRTTGATLGTGETADRSVSVMGTPLRATGGPSSRGPRSCGDNSLKLISRRSRRRDFQAAPRSPACPFRPPLPRADRAQRRQTWVAGPVPGGSP